MADEVKKSGRPKKKAPNEIKIRDTAEQLVMSETPHSEGVKPVTITDVRQNMIELYTQTLNRGLDPKNCANSYNPFMQNQRLKMINNTPPHQLDREKLIEALDAPQNTEQSLRAQGWSSSASQYLYYKTLRMSADIPLFKHYIVPELLDESKYKSADFLNEYKFVEDYIKVFDLPNTLKRMALEVKREGKPAYLIRTNIDDTVTPKKTKYATFQKLPSDFIKIVGIGEHGYIVSFNMMVFMNPGVCIDQYPDYIRDIWDDMMQNEVIVREVNKKKQQNKLTINRDKAWNYTYNFEHNGHSEVLTSIYEAQKLDNGDKTYMLWVTLPQDFCYVFCSDTSTPWAIPDTSGMFLGLQELTDYDQLAGLLQSSPLTAVLTAEASFISDTQAGQDQTELNPETISGFQDNFNSRTSSNLEAFFAPLKNFKLLSLPDVPNANQTTTNATKNFIYRNGLGGLIITTDKPSLSQVNMAKILAEAECDFLTLQFKSAINNIINKLIGCNYTWKVEIWGNIFSFADERDKLKELFVAGSSFIVPRLLSAYDMTLFDARAEQLLVDSVDFYSSLRTITQVMQEKNKDEQKNDTAGRPALSDDRVANDNTAASKDTGLDTAETRSYTFDGKCVLCGKESDNMLCEECLERFGLGVEEVYQNNEL